MLRSTSTPLAPPSQGLLPPPCAFPSLHRIQAPSKHAVAPAATEAGRPCNPHCICTSTPTPLPLPQAPSKRSVAAAAKAAASRPLEQSELAGIAQARFGF